MIWVSNRYGYLTYDMSLGLVIQVQINFHPIIFLSTDFMMWCKDYLFVMSCSYTRNCFWLVSRLLRWYPFFYQKTMNYVISGTSNYYLISTSICFMWFGLHIEGLDLSHISCIKLLSKTMECIMILLFVFPDYVKR